jgi:hypothetical protein
MMRKSNVWTGARSGPLRPAAATWLAAAVFAVAMAAPFGLNGQGLGPAAAYAGNGNGNGAHGGGNGSGTGRDDAPGQQKQLAGDDGAADDAAISSVAEGTAEGGETDEGVVMPIAEDAEPATNRVIKELAGLPEDSALSEEEELEAIRNGWGTWRTADGPETVIAQ